MSEITSKFCGGCQQEKPTENFYKEKRSKDGYLYRCDKCNTRLPIVESPIWKASAEAYLEKY